MTTLPAIPFIYFIFGLIIGSFINVCVYRIPRDQSLWFPGSRCPGCGTAIRWFDNIPVMSYLLLRGSCRSCGTSISLRYPLMELLTGISFGAVGYIYGSGPVFSFFILYYTFALITISGIDYSHQIIPDLFSLSLVIMGLAASPFNPFFEGTLLARLLASFLGGMAGGGILLFIGFTGEKILKKEVMGGGDVKLLAGIGCFLGAPRTFCTLFIAALIGSVIGISLILTGRMKRRDYLPFGPFLALAAWINLFLPDPRVLLSFIWG